MRGDVQECLRGAVPGGRRIRRDEIETSLQHKTKSSIRYMVELRTSDTRASKVAGSTPGEPLRLCVRSLVEHCRKSRGTG